jgi:hypothetical protein
MNVWNRDPELFDLARRESFTCVVNGILFADIDGVIVVPSEIEDETFSLALEKIRGEKKVKTAIEGGKSACATFARFVHHVNFSRTKP